MANKPFYIEWDSFSVMAIVGASGSGKTSTARLMLCQLLLNDIDIMICDPHGYIENQSLTHSIKPLQQFLLQPIAIDKDSRIRAIRHAGMEFNKRKNNPAASKRKFVLIIDELTAHFMECDSSEVHEQEQILLAIANQARKVNMRIILIGQNWKQDYIGSRSVRSSINAIIFHRINGDEVKLLSENTPATIRRQITQLKQGYAILYSQTNIYQYVKIPYISIDDIRDFATRIESRNESRNNKIVARDSTESRHSNDVKPLRDSDSFSQKIPQNNESLDKKQLAIIAAIKSGKTKEQTIKDIFGYSKGSKYKPYLAAARLYDRIKELMNEQ